MAIHRRASIIAATGWTFEQLDEQETYDVNSHLEWLNIREGVRRQEAR